jgi:hypothetical protein
MTDEEIERALRINNQLADTLLKIAQTQNTTRYQPNRFEAMKAIALMIGGLGAWSAFLVALLHYGHF